ncbi:MAG: DUF3267 domain-containing protein [Gemmatimonadetes bacterium]|nr:DUF3267 domain-containing protein [Gemmatimonadota bacterium]
MNEPSNGMMPAHALEKIMEHVFPRERATLYGLGVGILVGIGNSLLDLEFPINVELAVSLIGAMALVVVLHEGVHGGVGKLLGHRPIFGVQPPLVFTTFREAIPRGHFIAIAIAPLLVLDAIFVAVYAMGVFRLFMDLCFAVNTIGTMGDVWIVLKLSRHARGTVVQDTKQGIEVWAKKEPRAPL